MKGEKISTPLKKAFPWGESLSVCFVLLFKTSNSVLLCFGLYLGSELLKVGDT